MLLFPVAMLCITLFIYSNWLCICLDCSSYIRHTSHTNTSSNCSIAHLCKVLQWQPNFPTEIYFILLKVPVVSFLHALFLTKTHYVYSWGLINVLNVFPSALNICSVEFDRFLRSVCFEWHLALNLSAYSTSSASSLLHCCLLSEV